MVRVPRNLCCRIRRVSRVFLAVDIVTTHAEFLAETAARVAENHPGLLQVILRAYQSQGVRAVGVVEEALMIVVGEYIDAEAREFMLRYEQAKDSAIRYRRRAEVGAAMLKRNDSDVRRTGEQRTIDELERKLERARRVLASSPRALGYIETGE